MTKLATLYILSLFIAQRKAITIYPQWICLNDIKTCPDGSALSRDPNNNCQFPECPISPCPNTHQCINPISGECSYMAPCPNGQYCPIDPISPFYITCNAYPSAQCRFTGCGGCVEYFVDNLGNVINDCNADICSLPADAGLCRAAIPRYFYNSFTGQCEQFNYGGCDGNANNFNTLTDCQNACGVRAGDPCNNCLRPLCPCGLCADGVNSFGCCGRCIYKAATNGELQCIYEGNTVCPATSTTACATVDCKPGHNCYDASSGPICCDPAICATGGECGGIRGLQCKQGFECVNDPMTPCLGGPTGAGCPKICVNPDATVPISTCCDPLMRPDGLNGNPICFEGSACCPDGSWSCSIGDGRTFPCGGELFNKQTNPTAFGEICSNCPVGQCLNPSGTCAGSVLCFANPCEVNKCPLATSCESNYCGGCHAVFKDANGNVIDPTNCMGNSVGCAVNHCNSYNDGCNICGCTPNGISICTMKACGPLEMTTPVCTGCEAGYELNQITNKCEACIPGFIWNPTTKKCEGCTCIMVFDPVCCNDGNTYSNSCHATCQHANGCNPGACPIWPPPSLSCGGFLNCANYNDGCNDCICSNNGMDICTERACFVKGIPKCTRCKAGYVLHGNVCVV